MGDIVETAGILCLLTLSLAKCSVLALIRRIIGSKPGKSGPVCIGLMVITVVWGVGSCLAWLVNCRADSLLTLDNVKQCPHQNTRWAVITAMDILTETLTWLLVLQLSWSVNISYIRKCQVVMAFSFRIPLIALSAVHLAYTATNPASLEPQFAVTKALLCQQIMVAWSLISATVPNLKNFLKSFSMGMGFPASFNLSISRSSNVYALQSLGNNSSGVTSSAAMATAVKSTFDSAAHSQPHSWRPDEASTQTTTSRDTGSNSWDHISEEGRNSRAGSQEMIINKEVTWKVTSCTPRHITFILPPVSGAKIMSEIALRDARYSELPEIAHIMSEAFWKDNLFGELIHPHRNKYPSDVHLYWLRRARVNFWDYRWRWLVAVAKDESGQEIIAGIAQWARLGDGGQKLECWYLDPRNLLKPLSSIIMNIHAWAWPNRASDSKEEDIIERAYPYFEDIWSGKRAESWYLEGLAVRPDFQGKNVGRKLVQWGLEQAKADGICASVISAFGTEEFYKKCGFHEQYGSARQGEGNPLADVEGANMFWKWPEV
ncbi:hypothetical protein DER44DRAFT_844475 [Fusarium oxysporum]|nr:hypothetical protein DER44DRAFT_844475 [Fusarium oxysporum]